MEEGQDEKVVKDLQEINVAGSGAGGGVTTAFRNSCTMKEKVAHMWVLYQIVKHRWELAVVIAWPDRQGEHKVKS